MFDQPTPDSPDEPTWKLVLAGLMLLGFLGLFLFGLIRSILL